VVVIDEVVAAAAAEAVEAASATSVVYFGSVSWKVKLADSPTPKTTSSVLNQREVAGAVEEEVEAAAVVADDRLAVVDWSNRHKVPVENPMAVNTRVCMYTYTHLLLIYISIIVVVIIKIHE